MDAFLEAKFQIWSIIEFRTFVSVTVIAVNRVHANSTDIRINMTSLVDKPTHLYCRRCWLDCREAAHLKYEYEYE